MSLLNKLTLKNLKLNKKRTRVTILGVILSVALITSVANIFSSVKATIAKEIINNYGDFHYYFENVPSTDIKYFKDNRYIEKVYLTKNLGYAENPDIGGPYFYINVKALTEDSFNNLGIELVSGRLPQNSHEIILYSRGTIYNNHKYKIGDEITFELGTQVDRSLYEKDRLDNTLYTTGGSLGWSDTDEDEYKVTNTTSYTYKIVGFYNGVSNKINDSYSYVHLTKMDDEDLNGNYNLYVRYTKQGLKKQTKVTANLINYDLDKYEYIFYNNDNYVIKWSKSFEKVYQEFFDEVKYIPYYNNDLIIIETDWTKDADLKPIAMVCSFIAVIIIITSILCIKNSFDISVTEKVRQYGMLSSIGATKKQIRHSIYYEALLLCLIGIPLGLITGFLLSYLLLTISSNILTELFNSSIVFQISIDFVILSIILSIITIFLSSLRSAFKASKLNPIEAIRNNENLKIKKSSLKVPSIITKLFGIGGNISYKNIRRNQKKYRPIIISLVICLILFISVSYFINIIYEVNLSYYDFNYNMTLYIDTPEMENIDEVYALDSIKEYSSIVKKDLTAINFPVDEELKEYRDIDDDSECNEIIHNYNSMTIIKLGTEEYKRYIKKLGLKYDDIKDKGILIDSEVIKSYNMVKKKDERHYFRRFAYNVGDEVTIYPRDINCQYGDSDLSITYPIEIGYITDKILKNKPLPLGLRFDNNLTYSELILSDEYFDKLYPEGQHYEIYINSKDPSKTEKEISNVLGSSAIYRIDNYEQEIKELKGRLLTFNIFLYSFIGIVLLISITSVFNTVTTSIETRQREFATLKSVGMSSKEFNKMISLESIFIGLKSLIIGLSIGCILSYVIYDRYMENNYYSKIENPYHLPYLQILISIIVILFIVILIMRYSLNKTKKQNIIETIRKENI